MQISIQLWSKLYYKSVEQSGDFGPPYYSDVIGFVVMVIVIHLISIHQLKHGKCHDPKCNYLGYKPAELDADAIISFD